MKRVILIFFTLFMFSPYAYTQNDSNDFRSKIDEIKIEKLTDKLNLNGDTKEIFISKYIIFSKDIKELNRKRNKTIRKIEQNIDNDIILDSLLSLLISYENDITNRRAVFIEDLKTILTVKQIATIIIYERNFAVEMRKIFRNFRKRGRN